MDRSHNFSQTSKLIVKDYTLYPSKQYLTSKIMQVLELGSPIHNDTTERDYTSKERVSDGYLQNSKINNDLQSFNKDIVKPISRDLELSNKLFDQKKNRMI
jgi:hypothetical protein